jgi:hypothetical protein
MISTVLTRLVILLTAGMPLYLLAILTHEKNIIKGIALRVHILKYLALTDYTNINLHGIVCQ